MSEYVRDTIKHKGLTIKIIADTDVTSPRKDFDNFGTMVCWHRRYELGDTSYTGASRDPEPSEWREQLAGEYRDNLGDYLGNKLFTAMVTTSYSSDPEELKVHNAQMKAYYKRRAEIVDRILDKHCILLPLRLLDHSGISMSVGSGAHPCDPGGWDSGQVGWIYCTKKKAVEEFGKKACTKKVIEQAEALLKAEVETYDQFLTGDVWGYVIEDEEGEQLDSCWGMYGADYCEKEAIEAADGEIQKAAREAVESPGDIPMVARV